MSYYPKHKCFLCSSPVHSHSPWRKRCISPDCYYEVTDHSFTFSLVVNHQNYDVRIYASDNTTVIDKRVHSLDNPDEIRYDAIYEVEEVLEMPADQWIEFIERLEKLRVFT